jgi:hypothetical protein
VDEALAVSRAAQPVPPPREVLAQLAEVVDLAVEDRHNLAVLAVNGLVTGGHIDDREAPHAERRMLVVVEPRAVGTPVNDHVAHPADQVGVRAQRRRHSGYPTHRASMKR